MAVLSQLFQGVQDQRCFLTTRMVADIQVSQEKCSQELFTRRFDIEGLGLGKNALPSGYTFPSCGNDSLNNPLTGDQVLSLSVGRSPSSTGTVQLCFIIKATEREVCRKKSEVGIVYADRRALVIQMGFSWDEVKSTLSYHT